MNTKPRLRVKLLVDTEADFYYNISSPHFSTVDLLKWKLNKIIGKLYRYPWPSRKGFINLIECFKKYEQKATFCIVGHLYLKECNGFPHYDEIKPRNEWYKSKIGDDWYYWDHGGNYKTKPGTYLGDIIESEKNNPLFEFGLHAFTHEALTIESKEVIDSIIKSGIKAAQKFGIKIDSFACPFEMTSDDGDPDRIFDILKKYKIKKIFHAGQDKGLQIRRYFSIQKPVSDEGLEKIWISNYFEGTSKQSHISKILKEIWENRDKDAVYCLGTHDFTHKNANNATRIIRFLKDKGFS
jgi:peptidoglycan/xylan/chitin deacetylase (PgdA/CDA1 family)